MQFISVTYDIVILEKTQRKQRYENVGLTVLFWLVDLQCRRPDTKADKKGDTFKITILPWDSSNYRALHCVL